MNNPFRHRCLIDIRFVDMDALGHVNNANYFTYIEQARIDYFKTVIGENINWALTGLILAHAEMDYKIPIVLGDSIYVYTQCTRLGNRSFDMAYRFVKLLDGTEMEMATGKTTLVCYDYSQKSTIPIPELWRRCMMEYDQPTTL